MARRHKRSTGRTGGRHARARGVASLFALMLALPVPSGISYASNFGSECATFNGVATCVSLGNNSVHNFYFGNVEVNQRVAVSWVSLNVYNPTDVNTSETPNADYADVRVWDSTYGLNNIWGWVDCPSHCPKTGSHPNRTGFRQELRFNLSYPNAFDTQFERRYMACHEFGHTLGLRHNGNTGSCMYANAAWSNVLDSHDIVDHLNAKY